MTAVKVTMLHDAGGSEGAAAARAVARHAPDDVVVSILALESDPAGLDRIVIETDPAVVVLFSNTSAPAVRAAIERQRRGTFLATVFHAGWAAQVPEFFDAYQASDLLCISNRDYWDRTGRLPGVVVVPWGVDADVFRVTQPIDHRRHVVLWSGPAEEPVQTGYDRVVEPIAREVRTFWGIGCELRSVDPVAGDLTPEERAAWYNTGTVFICASRHEGTPLAALEAAACGCTVVSTPVGCLPELIVNGENGYLVDRTCAAMLDGLTCATRDYYRLAHRMQHDIESWSWRVRAAEIYEAVRAGLLQRPTSDLREDKPDFSADVTVFVTSIGASSYSACRELLRRQDCNFRLEVIEGVTPLSAALQQMLDRCETPYYAQVDEDMLLRPHAIRVLYEELSAAPSDVAMVVGQLYDVHLRRCIQGVKLFRHAIARAYPWEEEPVSIRRVQQMQADGYRVIELQVADAGAPTDAIGVHGTHATPEMLYDRYATLERLRRAFPRTLDWFEPVPATFLERFMEDGDEADLQALLGVLAGALAGPLSRGAEVRDGREGPNRRNVQELLERLRQGSGRS